MRTARKNKQTMHYALKDSLVPKYEHNADGTIKYITIDGVSVAVETGESEIGFSLPIKFQANISQSGESEATEFGLSISDYDAVIVLENGSVPINETSIIWHESAIGYSDDLHTIVNPNTADYRVVAVKKSLNSTKYVLKRLTK